MEQKGENYWNSNKVFTPADKENLLKIVSYGNMEGNKESFVEVSQLIDREFNFDETSPNFLSAILQLSADYQLGMQQLIQLVFFLRKILHKFD